MLVEPVAGPLSGPSVTIIAFEEPLKQAVMTACHEAQSECRDAGSCHVGAGELAQLSYRIHAGEASENLRMWQGANETAVDLWQFDELL